MTEVSILLPVFNGGPLLRPAVDSVLLQTFSDWELLIIDDGSTDGSVAEIRKLAAKDGRIKFIVHSENRGLTASLNDGLAAAAGRLVARIDSDDAWSNSAKLEKQLKFLRQNPRVGLLGTAALMVDELGRPKRELNFPVSDYAIRKQILIHNCFVHSSILASRQLMLDCGGYDPKETYVEDYGLWLRMGLKAELCNLPEIMVSYRVNPLGITRSRHKAQVAAAAKLVAGYSGKYPNYSLARVKWAIQKFLTA